MIIYILTYAISLILAYIVVFTCCEVYVKYSDSGIPIDSCKLNIRHKRPIWFYIALIGILCIPLVNVFSLVLYMWYETEEHDRYYNTFLNKKI